MGPKIHLLQLNCNTAKSLINRNALMRASVKDGRIVLPGGASYAMIVLPDAVPMTAAVARKLRDLHKAGASIYGTRPGASPTLSDGTAARAETAALLDGLWGSAGTPMSPGAGPVIASGDLGAALRGQGILPDVETGVTDALLWTHREQAGQQLYFLSNPSDNLVKCEAVFRSQGRVSLHDPVADRWTLPPARHHADGRTALSLSLPPSGSVFVRFDEAAGARITAIETRTPGPLPLLSETDGALFAETETTGQWTIRTGAATPLALEVSALPSAIGLNGPWDVRFEGGGQPFAVTMTALRSWSEEHDPAIRFHSGTATYRTKLRLPAAMAGQRWRLDPGVFANIVRVRVNGNDCGIVWVPGTSLDVTDALVPGSNLIEIVVANTWRNRLVGDRAMPETDRTTWVLPNRLGARPAPILSPDAGLLQAGLLGPVRLMPFARVKVGSRQATE